MRSARARLVAELRCGARSGWRMALHQRPERLVDRLVRREGSSNVGSQQHQVRPGAVALQILAADTPFEHRGVVLGTEVVVLGAQIILPHRVSSLCASRRALDDAGEFAPVGVRYDKQVSLAGMAECQKAILFLGMIGIRERDGQWIAKDGARLMEGDAVLGEITRGLLRLPLELHRITVARQDWPSKGVGMAPRRGTFPAWGRGSLS